MEVKFLLIEVFNYVIWLAIQSDASTISLGVIQSQVPDSKLDTKSMSNINITVTRYVTDFTEYFHVFKKVRTLDADDVTDIIVLENNANLTSVDTAMFTTTRKPLVWWGRKPLYTEINYFKKDGVHTKRFLVENSTEMPGKEEHPYCLDVLKKGDVINNDTFVDIVPLTGANVVSSLITKHLNWKSVFIFFENSTEREESTLVDLLSSSRVLNAAFNVDTTPDLMAVLQKIYSKMRLTSSDINMVVLCQSGCVQRILSEANAFDSERRGGKALLKQLSRWLVASYDHTQQVATKLTSCANDLDNVAVVAFPKPNTPDTDQGLLTAMRTTLNEILTTASVVENITTSFKEHIAEKLQEVVYRDTCEGLKIETLMWLHEGRGFSNLGYVTKDGKVVIFSDLFPNTNYGYNKRHFLVSTLHYPPFVVKSIVNNTASYGGMCMDLLWELARTLNFTFTLTEPEDQKWGSPGPNNTFNGLIGQLQREEVDIVAADISIQKEREMVMDFAFPFYYGDTSVLIKKPDPNARKWRTLVDPLKWQVLTAVGVLLLVVSLLMFLFERFNAFYDHVDRSDQTIEPHRLHTFHDAFWYMYGALLCQGGVHLPESTTGRTFVSHWWLFSIILVGTYSGNLIAFLTVTKVKPAFNTLEEMVDLKNEYKWGTQSGTHWEHVFKTSTRREFREVGDLMMEFNRTDPAVMAVDFSVHLNKVKQGLYGWIGDTVIIEVEMAKDCDLIMIKEKFLPLKYAFGFTNNSPHAKIFSEQMLSIHESGLLHVWKRRWWPKSSICASSTVPEAKPISVIDVQSAFYVAAGGTLIGFIAFITELLIGYHKRKRRKANDKQVDTSTVGSEN